MLQLKNEMGCSDPDGDMKSPFSLLYSSVEKVRVNLLCVV